MNLLILHVKKSFNIFHSSVDGYECHSDGLQEILSKSSINFDVVCLSETSETALCSFWGYLLHAVTKSCSLQTDSQIVQVERKHYYYYYNQGYYYLEKTLLLEKKIVISYSLPRK